MTIEEIQKSNKKIAFSAFVFSFLMVVVLHAALISMLRRDYEQDGKILTNQIIDSFYLPTIGKIQQTGNMVDSSEYQDFINQVTSFIKNYPAANINIYDANHKKIFSSNDQDILIYKDSHIMDYVAGFFLERADQEVRINHNHGSSKIIWSADLGMKKDLSFIKVAEPMYVNKTRVGTVEITYDFTRHMIMMDNTRFFCLMLLIGVIASYFILINRNFEEMRQFVVSGNNSPTTLEN